MFIVYYVYDIFAKTIYMHTFKCLKILWCTMELHWQHLNVNSFMSVQLYRKTYVYKSFDVDIVD